MIIKILRFLAILSFPICKSHSRAIGIDLSSSGAIVNRTICTLPIYTRLLGSKTIASLIRLLTI